MSNKPLPVKLNKEPLIEVLCAVHFSSDVPAESLLPGLLLSKLATPNPKIEPLGAAQLPQVIRDNDPNLQNAPLMRILVDDQHFILIGSRWLAVGCQIPYSGWSEYKKTIISVFSILGDAGFVKNIERHSLRYVDFIKSQDAPSSLSIFDLKINIAGRPLDKEQTQLRTEIIDPDFLHAITIISKANLNKPGESAIEGVLLDVDTHRVQSMSPNEFKEGLNDFLEAIHSSNKKIFFDLLSDFGLERLEPIYD
ncbi:TIGR04255 family protein [Zoogloea sp.]|uniref:TIGR04255 family protein n=1 Tax=Zoogloea sp. TaxID=49181 RepID=UPI0035AFFA3E